jgi:ubiquinone/menaquinone biosynthesis C-methylase UbiE
MTQTNPDTTTACRAFSPSADSYDRLMGRYLPSLAPQFARAAGVDSGTQLLDVGCGPGGLTAELVRRASAANVAAIDPSLPFVQECRRRNPGVDVRQGVAEQLPFEADHFDASLASLVVGFMSDPHQGLAEMARVTRPAGTVAVCFWDQDRMPVLRTFWSAAKKVNPMIAGEMRRLGGAPGELAASLRNAGLHDVRESEIVAQAHYTNFDDFWMPFTLGVGPIGLHYESLDNMQRQAVRSECIRLLDPAPGPFTLQATCWFATGKVPNRAG